MSIILKQYSMSRLILSFSFLLFSFIASAQKYTPVDGGSKVHFTIKNFGISTGGDLSELKGDIAFVPQNITTSKFTVSVNVNTIDTDNETRDTHLKSKEYFNAEKFPEINISSTRITYNKSKKNTYYFTGNIAMHGITKPITFPFTAVQKGSDYLFTSSFDINRLDFGIGSSSTVLSNTVKISLSVLAKKS